MKYVRPSVKLLDQSIPELGYFTWLKSRQWVITDLNGNKFMVDFLPDSDWMNKIPNEFLVGTELVGKFEYLNRVNKMNLQFNNMETQIYEITGSCLFRDILFNINKISAWAQSNRFLFSILGDDAVYNEDNYAVSAEYEGIPEWEDQFKKYMEAIKLDKVVDHNRLEMPYSISSTFWIGINKKTLLDLLSFLRKYAPFFYDVYGLQFTVPGLTQIPIEPSSAITQYLLKNPEKFKEMSMNIQGTQIVNSKMGLILYSQFIRQADTRVCGLFNEIIHTDIGKFIHKVFKGGTIINIHYVADIDKALSTVKTRLCAFAMSSGDDPCSWSYFLNNFLPKDLSPEKFMNMLPCKFDGCKLIDCKFRDDIKFRNEGKEVSNCPCPIFTGSLEHAEFKKARDNNRIGNAYYELTKFLRDSGLPYKLVSTWWTSMLTIKTGSQISEKAINEISSTLKYWETEWSNCNKTGSLGIFEPKLSEYSNQFPEGDFTCAMKGMAIDMIAGILDSENIKSYLIDFGGDIYCHNCDTLINIEGTKFNIEVNRRSDWSIFTSGNTKKRGNHIIGCPEGQFTTLVIKWNLGERNNTIADIASTKFAANDFRFPVLLDTFDKDGVTTLIFDEESGNLINRTYCASPFFNPKQIEIRDQMASGFYNLFRPDLTKESFEYEEDRNGVSVANVVLANIEGINQSLFLVYPERTTDLGTLWELGYALASKLDIIKFDENQGQYILELNGELSVKPNPENKYLFDCSSKVDAISLGYLSKFVPADNIYYQLNGMPDNIMLSVNYHHVELNESGNLVEYERDKDARDQ